MEKKRLILPLVFMAIIVCLLTLVTFLKNEHNNTPRLNVLMLHMVTNKMPDDPSLNTLYITDDMLRKYCEYFKDRYTIVSLDTAYDIIENNKKVDNPNLMAFTFDDGYDNNYTLAYPILKELNIEANINIIAKYTDEKRDGYLTWNQVKEMSDSGLITIGSHTYDSHYYTLSDFGDERPMFSTFLPGETEEARRNRIFTDLKLADDMIEKAIGKEINALAYPYGVPPFDLMEDIKNEFGYKIQMLVRTGVNKGEGMFMKLNRFAVDGTMEPSELDEIIKIHDGLRFLHGSN